jgi:mannose-6-phosphate isomerase
MRRVFGVVQNYAWGKFGSSSNVALLHSGGAPAPAPAIVADAAYAELWLGTHPRGHAQVADDTGAGERVTLQSATGKPLPYLFKALSVRTALSIQAHPDKERARQLHADRPADYKDPNHKPELACAVTPFEAMCSFRPLREIAHFLRTEPELRRLIGDAHAVALENAAHGGEVGTHTSNRSSNAGCVYHMVPTSFCSCVDFMWCGSFRLPRNVRRCAPLSVRS